jgi:hypothetical protein
VLVFGSFRGQATENVKAQLRREKSDLAIIPGGMTGLLQTLDVVINRPVKAHIRRSYSEWAHKPRGDTKRATLTEMCRWILEGWLSTSQDMTAKSFKVSVNSKKTDGFSTISCGIDPTKKVAKRTLTDSEDD